MKTNSTTTAPARVCDICARNLRPEAATRCAPCICRILEWERVATARGRDAAEAAATWATDGNSDAESYRQTLARIEAGDDVSDVLPAMPSLSGEWAGDPTPASLVDDIAGPNIPGADILADILADAFESGVSERFESACAEALRAAI